MTQLEVASCSNRDDARTKNATLTMWKSSDKTVHSNN